MICELCGKAMNSYDLEHTAYRFVSGWEKPRTAGGTNALALREVTDKRAHAACVRLVSDGINVGQAALI
jgi:hypothetical protein